MRAGRNEERPPFFYNEAVRCLSCRYDLKGQAPGGGGEHRCPECGRAFDPADLSTFGVPPARPRGIEILAAALIVVALVIMFLNRIQVMNYGAPLYRRGTFMGRPAGIHMRQVGEALLAIIWLACAARLVWVIRRHRTDSAVDS